MIDRATLTEREKLNLYRQWFNAVQDLHPAYLEYADYALAKEIYERLGARVPHSILRALSLPLPALCGDASV